MSSKQKNILIKQRKPYMYTFRNSNKVEVHIYAADAYIQTYYILKDKKDAPFIHFVFFKSINLFQPNVYEV